MDGNTDARRWEKAIRLRRQQSAEESIKDSSVSQSMGTTLEYTPAAAIESKKAQGRCVRQRTQEQLIGLFLRLVCTSHEPRGSNVITLVLQRKSAQKGLGLTLGTYVDRWRNDDGSISVDEREKDLSYHRVDGIKSGSIAERQGILLGDVILELNGTCMLALFRCDRSFACRPKLARI